MNQILISYSDRIYYTKAWYIFALKKIKRPKKEEEDADFVESCLDLVINIMLGRIRSTCVV